MAKKYLTLNIGAATVELAEYEASSKGALTLVNYGTAHLAAPLDGGNAETILSPAILEIVREKGIRPGPVAVAISGQMAFQRFAAIPTAGGEEKFEQMVRYEVEQNIPFPIDEMVCDRQVLGETENGDILGGGTVSEVKGIKADSQFWDDQKIMGANGADGKPMIERRQGLVDRSKTIWALVNPNDYEATMQ